MTLEYIEMTVSSLVMLVGFWISAEILFDEKSKKDTKGIFQIIIGSLMMAIFNMNKEINGLDFAKIAIIYLMIVLFYKNRYKIQISESLIGSAIIYGNILIADQLSGIGIYIISKITKVDMLSILKYNIVISLVVVIISLLVLKLLKKNYLKLYRKIKTNDTNLVGVIVLVFAIIIIISGIMPLKQLDLGIEMLILLLLMIGFFIIGLYIVYEKIEKQKEFEKYTQLSEYSKVNEGLLEAYRVSCHENKNHLIIIDNMVPKSNKKVHQYISSIINNEQMDKYYFINELKNIPITELKGFINFKLMKMLDEKIKLQINVSPEIMKSKLKRLSLKEKEILYNIIGVLIDNAYEASRESKEKEVVLQMYKEESAVVILLANTYKGKVEIEKVAEYGYTSKGKNHGTGLYMVDKLIKKNEKMEIETSLLDNYFIQILKIK